MEEQQQAGDVPSRLPWLVAAGALVVYLLTLNHWVSLASLPVVSGLTDPDALTPLSAPLHFVVTYPFRWLPIGIRIIALNLFSATCAALTLALLARSVALLPHDRTREQRHRERSEFSLLSIPAAWAPPLFAVLICGLQLSFWEHATAATGEMLDLLLFAYLIRCLLEYRISERESWLTRMAFVYGLATTDNYGMIGFFPAFLFALIWIKGRDFFQGRFIVRMLGAGIAGLLLYLLLPLLMALDASSGLGFWQSLRIELVAQKNALLVTPRIIVLLAGLTSLLPTLIIGIRWPSSFGDTSAIGNLLTNWVFRIVHGLFLLACLFVAYGPPLGPFSARALMDRMVAQSTESVVGLPFLTFYYLGALCVGYFAGYYLLVFGPPEERTHRRPAGAGSQLLSAAVVGVVWLLIVAAPLALVYRNLTSIRINNGSLLRDYAELSARALPPGDSILLADDGQILVLTQIYLNERRVAGRHLLADTRLLRYPVYQKLLRRRAPEAWPELPPGGGKSATLETAYLMYQLTGIASSNVAFYLHPSFGYYFEPLYMRPRGLVYRLAAYRTNDIAPPALPAESVAENNQYWTELRPRLETVSRWARRGITDARTVGRWYSRALTYWGVTLQRQGSTAELPQAAQCFELARQLNPDNLIAEVNLAFNRTLQAPQRSTSESEPPKIQQLGAKYRTWNALLNANGPVDDPRYCVTLGSLLYDEALFRQATIEFRRVIDLQPDNLAVREWLAKTYLSVGLPDLVLETTQQARQLPPSAHLTDDEAARLTRLDGLAYASKGDLSKAEHVLREGCQRLPRSDVMAEALTEFYISNERLTNALEVIQRQLKTSPGRVQPLINQAVVCMKLQRHEEAEKALAAALQREPDNREALLAQGALYIQSRQFTNAVTALNHILERDPDNRAALMNRAIALLQSDQLDEARRDYVTLLREMPWLYSIHFGLGEIAYRLKEFPVALQHYEEYLKTAPPDTEEARQIRARVEELKGAKR